MLSFLKSERSVNKRQDFLQGLDLRVEHTHGLNETAGQGGHYHYDTTPQEVVYHGYFNIAESCYRVDRPKVTHMIGRD